jgi:hypothetical protein
MRTLKFIVSGQEIKPDPRCDFSGLIPGSAACVQAVFTFSKEWLSTPKVAAFYSRLGNEYPPQALKDGRSCTIPVEALSKRVFKLQILGKNGLVTNRLEIDQKGG